jgi:2-dehydro-3-deoxygluconokinase
MLIRLSPPGHELIERAHALQLQVAGAEANVAIALAQLGHAATMISVLPDNALGRTCLAELRRYGVDTSGIRFAPGRMGLYFVETGAGHRPTRVLYDREASAFASALSKPIAWTDLLAHASWLHVSGITAALSAEGAESVKQAVATADKLGIPVSLDCNHRGSIWSRRRVDAGAIMRDIVAHVQVLFASARDLSLILDRTPRQLEAVVQDTAVAGLEPQDFSVNALSALARFERLRYVASTVREETPERHSLSGIGMSRDGPCATGTYSLGTIVERIGSGDTFAAGFLHGMTTGLDLAQSLEFATAAACLKHSLPGDFSLATVQDVEVVMRGDISLRR